MKKKTALITGIRGQDGTYLRDLLLAKGYAVHGLVAPTSPQDSCGRDVELHSARLENFQEVSRLVEAVQPDECYHLAARSFVSYSFEDEFSTLSTNIGGTHNVLAAIRQSAPHCRLSFASTSEMFGKPSHTPQNERTPFHPRSVYGVSKAAGFNLIRQYREAHGLFASSAILYNHESPRRGLRFVTRKITHAVARIKLGLQDELRLGNLDSQRDWGFAGDYVEAMWRMLQHTDPEDFVIASGTTHSVQQFVEAAFAAAELDWTQYVIVDPAYVRPAETQVLCGDSSKAGQVLGWESRVSFNELVKTMVKSDLEQVAAEVGRDR